MPFIIQPLTPETFPALEDLFGSIGASNGCWCMYPQLGPHYDKRDRQQNHDDLRDLASTTPAPGLLAFDGDLCVGWCRIAPRNDLPWIASRPIYGPTDDDSAWAIPCFYVRNTYRQHGVTDALLAAAIDLARTSGATRLEACPVDTATEGHTRNMFPGIASTFARHGFTEVDRRRKDRPVMHLALTTTT